MYETFQRWVRTAVPLVVGWVLMAANVLGLQPDGEVVAGVVTVTLAAAYHTAFLALEALADKLGNPALRTLAGVFLGWARPPAR